MMELDPIYVDVIIQRWENFTGKKAKKINQIYFIKFGNKKIPH